MDKTTRDALGAIASTARSLTDELDRLLQASQGTSPESLQVDTADPGTKDAVWDPEVDPPRVAPKVVGTREEQDWCCLAYLGGIYAINKRYSRGASTGEVQTYAVKAGYRDGRSVTAWSKGNGATQNDGDKQRWLTEAGMNRVRGLVDKLDIILPADLAEPWHAPEFRSTV